MPTSIPDLGVFLSEVKLFSTSSLAYFHDLRAVVKLYSSQLNILIHIYTDHLCPAPPRLRPPPLKYKR